MSSRMARRGSVLSGLALSGLVLSACSAADDLGAFPEPSSEANASADARDAATSGAPSAPRGAEPTPPAPTPAGPSASAPRTPPPTKMVNDVALHPVLKAIAEKQSGFSRADGTWWSPLGCAPPRQNPSRISDADSGSPHGHKLYTLQISDFDVYAKETGAIPAPGRSPGAAVSVPGVAQAIVKVSYEPVRDGEPFHASFIAPVRKGGETFYAGERRDLFVMYRPTDAKVETDAGWLYGTVAPNGEVTSAGKVASCMGCHVSAPHGRLFGPRATD